MSWSTSELRVRLAPLNRFKPSSKIFYWPFQGGTSFVDLLCFCSVLCLLCFVRVCLYVLCGHLLGKGWPLGSRLWCLMWVCHFPIGILGQVWYLIVSIPDLCNLITFSSVFVTLHMVSLIRCSIWLYQFLILLLFRKFEGDFLVLSALLSTFSNIEVFLWEHVSLCPSLQLMKMLKTTWTTCYILITILHANECQHYITTGMRNSLFLMDEGLLSII